MSSDQDNRSIRWGVINRIRQGTYNWQRAEQRIKLRQQGGIDREVPPNSNQMKKLKFILMFVRLEADDLHSMTGGKGKRGL